MSENPAPRELQLDCPYCEAMVTCREVDEAVTCPDCGRPSRLESDYVDEDSGQLIFALVPLDTQPSDQRED